MERTRPTIRIANMNYCRQLRQLVGSLRCKMQEHVPLSQASPNATVQHSKSTLPRTDTYLELEDLGLLSDLGASDQWQGRSACHRFPAHKPHCHGCSNLHCRARVTQWNAVKHTSAIIQICALASATTGFQHAHPGQVSTRLRDQPLKVAIGAPLVAEDGI